MQIEDFESASALENFCLESAQFQQVSLMSPIHDAAAEGNLTKLIKLVSGSTEMQQIDIKLLNLIDEAKNTPLHWAAGANKTEVMCFLINNGCLLNEKNCLGDTPLHRAVWRGHRAAVKLLIESSVCTSEFNYDRQRPIDLARDSEVASMLKDSVVSEILFSSDSSESDKSDKEDGENLISDEEETVNVERKEETVNVERNI